MICENCGKEHDGTYGSGRFCSKSCAISFGNKMRTRSSETNKNISKGVKKYWKEHPATPIEYEYICEKCGETFISNRKISDKKKKHCPNCKRKVVHFQDIDKIDSIKDLSKRTVTKILERADKGCAICGWNESTCDIHHIVERSNGGTNDMSNLILLCPNCHRIVHTKQKYSKDFLFSHSLDKEFSDWKKYYYISN